MSKRCFKCNIAKIIDANFIVSQIRRMNVPPINGMVKYASRNIINYVKDQIDNEKYSNIKYLIVRNIDENVGIAEFKLNNEEIYMNYIYVSKNVRGRGIGGLIIKEAMNKWSYRPRDILRVDVFNDNKDAIKWYKNRGFIVTGYKNWYVTDKIKGKINLSFFIDNYIQSQNNQKRYGYSCLEINTEENKYCIDRIGSAWYRAKGWSWKNDRALITALNTIDRKRRIFVIDDKDEFVGEPIATGICMKYVIRKNQF